MRFVNGLGKAFVNYPALVTSLILALVALHYWIAQSFEGANIAAALATSEVPEPRDTLMSLSLGVAGVSAMVGGFAGVVVVFGLGTEHDRFRLLRRSGGKRLRASWISVVLSSLAGAFGAVVSAVIVIAFGVEPGMWVLEGCLLLTAHGAVRLTALLAGLARIVDENDRDAHKAERTVSSSQLIPRKRRA